MNLTLTQAYERTKDLSGALKAARAHEADCAADHEAKLRIAEIAAEAHNKAVGHCIELERERDELADHIAGLVRKVGEPHTEETAGQAFDAAANIFTQPAGQAFDAAANIFTQPADFHSAALANGEARLNEAFDKATSA